MNVNSQIISQLMKVNMAVISTVENDLEKYNINRSELLILEYLSENGETKTQTLGNVAHITSGAITYHIRKLIGKNLVEKIQCDSDKRVFWVGITKYGSKQHRTIKQEHNNYLDDLFSLFSNEEKLVFIDKMEFFTKTLNR